MLLGARNAEQASVNFGEIAERPLSRESLERIERVQRELGIGRVNPLRNLVSRLLHAIRG